MSTPPNGRTLDFGPSHVPPTYSSVASHTIMPGNDSREPKGFALPSTPWVFIPKSFSLPTSGPVCRSKPQDVVTNGLLWISALFAVIKQPRTPTAYKGNNLMHKLTQQPSDRLVGTISSPRVWQPTPIYAYGSGFRPRPGVLLPGWPLTQVYSDTSFECYTTSVCSPQVGVWP